MLYYAQKATGDDLAVTPACFHTGPADDHLVQASIDGINHLHIDTEEDGKQPTLSDILRAVHKCTASVNTSKEHFGGLQKVVGLICQDLQKMREHTTVAESRISDIDDKLNPLIKDTLSTARLAKDTDLQAEDMENHLWHKNVRFVGGRE